MTDKIRQAAPCICSTAYGITPETCGATTHHAANHPEASSGVRLDGETPMNKLDELIAKVIDAGCSCDMMNGARAYVSRVKRDSYKQALRDYAAADLEEGMKDYDRNRTDKNE